MKTLFNPGGFLLFNVCFVVFLLVFPEVRLFNRLESPSVVKGVFQGKISVLNFLTFISWLSFPQVSKIHLKYSFI